MFTVTAEVVGAGARGCADAALVQFGAHHVERRLVAFALAAQGIAPNGGLRDRAAAEEFLAAREALFGRTRTDARFRQFWRDHIVPRLGSCRSCCSSLFNPSQSALVGGRPAEKRPQ